MTTNALMELADRLASEADCQHRNALTFKKGTLGRDDHLHTESLLREAATQLRTAAAEGADPYGWLEPDTGNFVDHKTKMEMAFDARTYTLAIYTHPPTDSGAEKTVSGTPALWWNGETFDGVAIGPSVVGKRDKWHDIPLYRHTDSGAGRDGWFPIGSAPKDGTEILVFVPGKVYGDGSASAGIIRSVQWREKDIDYWHVEDNKHGPFPLRGGSPTHWKSLPPGPNTAIAGAAGE